MNNEQPSTEKANNSPVTIVPEENSGDLQDCSALEESHGAALDKLDEPLILYRDRKKALKKLQEGVVRTMICLGIILAIIGLAGGPWWHFAAVIYGIEILLIYIGMMRSHNTAVRPIIEMNQQGLHINSPLQIYSIPWDDVKEVRPFSFGYRYVGITLNQTLGERLQTTPLYKLIYILNLSALPFGYPPICVPDEFMPLDADSVAKLIEERRQHFTNKPGQISKLSR